MRIYSDKTIDPTLNSETVYHGTRIDRHSFSHPLLGRVAEVIILSGAVEHGSTRIPSVRSRECHINLIKLIVFAVIVPFQWLIHLVRPSNSLFKREVKTEIKDLQVVEEKPGSLDIRVRVPEAVEDGWVILSDRAD